MQTFAIVVSLTLTVVAVVMVLRTAGRMARIVGLGRRDDTRMDQPGRRMKTLLVETLGHTRMLKWSVPGLAHWFVFIGFIGLFGSLVEAYGQLFRDDFTLPLAGSLEIYGLAVEAIAGLTLLGILVLIGIRLANLPSAAGRRSRFVGSTQWHAYYVELTIVGVALAVFVIRGVRVALGGRSRTARARSSPAGSATTCSRTCRTARCTTGSMPQ